MSSEDADDPDELLMSKSREDDDEEYTGMMTSSGGRGSKTCVFEVRLEQAATVNADNANKAKRFMGWEKERIRYGYSIFSLDKSIDHQIILPVFRKANPPP